MTDEAEMLTLERLENRIRRQIINRHGIPKVEDVIDRDEDGAFLVVGRKQFQIVEFEGEGPKLAPGEPNRPSPCKGRRHDFSSILDQVRDEDRAAAAELLERTFRTHAGCGYDLWPRVLAIPCDGVERALVCPSCGAAGRHVRRPECLPKEEAAAAAES